MPYVCCECVNIALAIYGTECKLNWNIFTFCNCISVFSFHFFKQLFSWHILFKFIYQDICIKCIKEENRSKFNKKSETQIQLYMRWGNYFMDSWDLKCCQFGFIYSKWLVLGMLKFCWILLKSLKHFFFQSLRSRLYILLFWKLKTFI